ncbi:TetR/AcrR family transcriptional regulator [Streptomyces sp. NRRL S-378]|uniref:TetR/AcrR family transcriptional regulator n=1 Tax=Streptomyces sp. NRRL S-378 TaxID=1463904 RepID=UPI000689AE40|nr:TetR/AcrR family transcriptional regulator [Streptomyces sp. NRRL S-378]
MEHDHIATAATAAAPTAATTTETATRARTRRAILDAAVSVLSANHGASLADVAEAAGVGRTTVHRYFAERSDLVAALGADVRERLQEATVRARVEEGPAPKALERLCLEYFELGDRLMLLFDVPQFLSWAGFEEETDSDRILVRLIERGQSEGTVDAEADAEWLQNVLWSLLYAAWMQARDYGTPRHTAVSSCLHTLRKAMAAS